MLTVVGDALLDRDVEGEVERLCPEAPVPVLEETAQRTRPGGAALAAALLAADGHEVVLVTALARDRAGRELARALARACVEVVDLGLEGTTAEKIRLRSGEHLLVRLDRGRPGRVGPLTKGARAVLADGDGVLVSDYGRGVAGRAREALAGRRVAWDPHPRGPEPPPGASLVTPNRREAGGESAERLRNRWGADAVAVTLGSEGAVVAGDRGELLVPAPRVHGGDPCGAGDRFAATAAAELAEGASAYEAVERAVQAASAFVAAGGAGALGFPRASDLPARDADGLVAAVRARGGSVVATGGCFDLLHAGHVALLEAARGLGDCLVVCLNSDESVRRLKGPDRPLVPQEDRAAVLEGLQAVDAVAVFDEDTPERLLERLRPDVWAKGGDYTIDELPEASLLERWGGRAVILPYVAGRSTTRLIAELQRG